ncbi:hypothetical protein [Dialister hominis]
MTTGENVSPTVPYIPGINEHGASRRVARDPETGKTVSIQGNMKYDD